MGKMIPLRKSFSFPFFRLGNGSSDLISIGRSEAGPPAKHPYGLRRAGQSLGPLPLGPQPACQPRDPTPRSGPETLFSSPTRDPFKLISAVPSGRDSSFLRTCVWGGGAKLFFCSFASDGFAS